MHVLAYLLHIFKKGLVKFSGAQSVNSFEESEETLLLEPSWKCREDNEKRCLTFRNYIFNFIITETSYR